MYILYSNTIDYKYSKNYYTYNQFCVIISKILVRVNGDIVKQSCIMKQRSISRRYAVTCRLSLL